MSGFGSRRGEELFLSRGMEALAHLVAEDELGAKLPLEVAAACQAFEGDLGSCISSF